MLLPTIKVGTTDPHVGSGKTPFTQSSLHPWGPEFGKRHPVETGAEAQGMEAPP